MRELPILCNAKVSLAIREGRQTQHRVPLRPQPVVSLSEADIVNLWAAPWQVGDQLYVREPWRLWSWSENGRYRVQYTADGSKSEWLNRVDYESANDYFLQCGADCENAGLELNEHGEYLWKTGECPTRNRPNIFMPKEFSRTRLKVTRVWCDRIQDMSQRDCAAEGVSPRAICDPRDLGFDAYDWYGAMESLWNSIYGNPKKGKPDYSWNANPYVWCCEFLQCPW